VTQQGLLVANWIGAVVMTAVIWFVQLVQYPLFASIGPSEFAAYAAEYQRRISWIVVGPMLVEVATAAALAVWFPGVYRSPLFATSVVLLVVVWASTFFWQVPLHERLLVGKDDLAIAELVRSNWLRTAAWTGRVVLLGWMLIRK
jgi:hypothetical protein